MPKSKTKKRMRASLLVVETLCVVSFCFASVTQTVYANTEQQYKKSVNDISLQIKKISSNLNANKRLLKTERDTLVSIEQELKTANQSNIKLQKQIAQQQTRLAENKLQVEALHKQHKTEYAFLAALIVQRYKNGEPNLGKLVLNQQNPYAVGRLDNYYEYFSVAQKDQLQIINAKLTEIASLETQQKSILDTLQKQRAEQKTKQSELRRIKNSRSKTIAKLNKKVESSAKKLEKLKGDRKRLNSLIKQIAIQAKKLRKIEQQRAEERKKNTQNNAPRPIRKLVKGGFKKQKGRLSFPLKGKIKTKFGQRLVESGMLSQGVFFETNAISNVHSIFRGRVLFADYLKGYGLLLIVDHGDEHISLYGHNEVIYKEVGDIVETNELVAKNGTSGGLKSPGLYFEIRHNANPINPSKWCR